MPWKRFVWGVSLGFLAGCGPADDERALRDARIGTARQADASDSITASPTPCAPAAGATACSTTVNWTEVLASSSTYQVVVQMDNGPWALFSCIPPNNPLRSQAASWIQPHHDYVFALRKNASSCSAVDPAASEVARVPVQASTASLTATPELVLTSGTGSSLLSWQATKNAWALDANHNAVPEDAIVWVLTDGDKPGGFYNIFSCSAKLPDGSISGSGTTTSVTKGHDYRFSLNLHQGGCAQNTFPPDCLTTPIGPKCVPDGPELAAVTLQGVQHYIKATPDRCSAASGGTCTTTLTWGTSSTGVTRQIWQNDGTSWTLLAGCPPTAQLQRTLTSGKVYSYELHLPTSCSAARTSTTAVATTTARALSGLAVREGTDLKVDGVPLRTRSVTKWDLFMQYMWKADYSTPLSCSDPDSGSDAARARTQMASAAGMGFQYLRILGADAFAGLTTWRTCPDVYWRRFQSMVSDAAATPVSGDPTRRVKLIVQLGTSLCQFSDAHNESMATLVQQPGSASRLELNAFVKDLLAGCAGQPGGCGARTHNTNGFANDTTIQGWELGQELNLFADIDYTTQPPADCTFHPQGLFTTDQMVSFVQSYGNTIKSLDPKHLVSAGYASPRPYAAHSRAWPVRCLTVSGGQCTNWATSPAGPCAENGANLPESYCPDDHAMFESYQRYINDSYTRLTGPDPIDLVSIHATNAGHLDNDPNTIDPENDRFGELGIYNANILTHFKRAAAQVGKPLFNADFMDCDGAEGCSSTVDHRRSFGRADLVKSLNLQIPLSTNWVWQFPSAQIPQSWIIGPGVDSLTDQYLTFFRNVNLASAGTTGRSMDLTPLNAGLDDTGSNQIPNYWTQSGPGTISIASESFDVKSVKLQPNGTDLLGLISTGTVPGMAIPAGARLVGSVAGLTHGSLTDAFVYFVAFDSTGAWTGYLTADLLQDEPEADHFRVRLAHIAGQTTPYLAIPSATRFIAVGLYAKGTGYAVFDDVQVSMVY